MNKIATKNNQKKDKIKRPHFIGHRKRLRQRFLRDQGQSMDDYELLELILTQALPRGDVKPLAKELIDKFGDFGNVIATDIEDLKKISGIGEAALVAIKLNNTGSLRLLKQNAFKGHVISGWDKLLDYCQAAMGREKIEQFRLLFLNNKNILIADEIQQYGTIDHTPLYPREVIKRALELHATSIIMVHNHPSGDPTPSDDDIAMTRKIKDAGSKLAISLHDHIIIGHGSYISFKSKGLI